MNLLKNKSILIILFIYLTFIGYVLFNYITTSHAITNTKPINYSLIEKKTSFWRGTTYKIVVEYNNEIYQPEISRLMYDSLEIGQKPALYFNSNVNEIVSSYSVSSIFKLLVAATLFMVILFLVFYFDKKQSK